MKRQCFVFICLAFLIVTVQLQAQNENPVGREYITEITILGLKRTKLFAAELPLRKFIGIEVDQLDQNEVWAAVLNTGIMDPISVEVQKIDAERNVLIVTVSEKWTIFPVPIVMVDSEGFSGGAALFDANAFGLNDKLFIGGLYLHGGWAVIAGYFHTSPGGQIPGINGMFFFSSDHRTDVDQNNNVLRSFDQQSISITARLNFSLLKNSDYLTASSHFSYNEKVFKNSENAFNGPETGLRFFGTGLSLSFNRNSWDGYFLSLEEASIQYSLNITANGDLYQSLNLRAVWEKSLIPGFKFVTRIGFVYNPNAPILLESSPSGVQVDILPRNFSARTYAGISAGLEKYLFKFSFGTLSVAASYQLVYSQGSILESSLDHGAAAKFSFYLSQLAIPAIGLGAAYNVKANYFQGIFSLGMSF